MSSDLIVALTKVKEIKAHSNADKLELGIIKGWQVVVQKDSLKKGDIVYYFPPDCLIPRYISVMLGVEQYLSFSKRYIKEDDSKSLGRVRAIKLRQEVSHGFIVGNDKVKAIADELGIVINGSLIETFGIEKWEPPLRTDKYGFNSGQAYKQHPAFFKYTNIQNIRHFPDTFTEDDDIVVTEKIHGSNVRVAKVKKVNSRWYKPWTWGREWVIGSHNVQRKVGQGGVYDLPLTNRMKEMIHFIIALRGANSVIVYGEVFGGSIQELKYGKDSPDFIVFDIQVDGKFIGWDALIVFCNRFIIPTVPVLYQGKFKSWEHLKEMSSGKTLLMSESPHIREGCVIKTIACENNKTARKIMKFVNDDYLTRKDGTEFH